MMTREEFLGFLKSATHAERLDSLNFDSRKIADHDAEQRAEIARLREALQLLYDVQNGCPLPKYQADWDRAMQLAQQAIKETTSWKQQEPLQ